MKKIKNYYYSLVYNELTIFIEDLNGKEYSVATMSEVKDGNCREIAEEIIEELGYQIMEE